jgi:Polyketide cyclase / dehydrase and lipid transport
MGAAMATVRGEIVIGRPVDVVFDYAADQSNEPRYNPRMVHAEKITPGPVGKGTRFRSAVATGGRTAELLCEITACDRPRLLESFTTMAQADFSYTLRFEPAAGGSTRMRWSGRVMPKGGYRLFGPLAGWLGDRQERQIWTAMKQLLEAAAAGPATGQGRGSDDE